MDVFGPMPETADGYCYGILVVEGLSGFVFGAAIADTKAMTTARFIHDLSGTFGYAKYYRWDNAPNFDNHLVKCLIELSGADRRPSVPFNPQSNGKVERHIGEIIRHVKYIVNDRRCFTDWDVAFPIARRLVNTAKRASIGLSPAEVMFPGRDLNMHMYPVKEPDTVTKYLKNEVGDKTTRDRVQAYVSNLVRLQAQAIKTAREFQSAVVMHRCAKDDPGKARSFNVDDFVVCQWRGGKPEKLSVEWRGPYRIVSRDSTTMYTLEDPADLKTYKKHVRELFAYKMDLTHDPRDVIAMDQAEALVDRIVDHKLGDAKKKSTWQFRIRWQDCTEDEDTWLPWAEVNPLEAFDRYLAENPAFKAKLKL